MEKEENTVAGTVEEKDKAEAVATETKVAETKAAEAKATDSDATNNKTADNKTANNKTADNNAVNDSDKESISDVDIININEEENKQKKSENSKKKGVRKAPPKNTNDFIANQKKRKRRKLFIILFIIAAVIGLIAFWISNSVKKAKEALAGLSANTVQTAFVEKKTLYDSKDATGTLYALESRTITRSLQGSEQGGAKINAINVEVGDHVSVGDVLVEFSKENVEKSIAEAKEDIGTQKQLDALNAEDEQRKYVYTYESAATSMKDAAQSVDDALKELYEACDAYGDAKRARDEAKEKAEEEGRNWDDIKASYEAAVTSAYQNEQQKQKAYDNAVKAQADGGQGSASSVANSLSEADSSYKKAQITAGETVKKLERQLNDSIDSLDDYIVYATIDGVVTEVNVSEGNTFVSGNVLTIQDDSGYKADVLVDEYDIPKVKKAYEEKKANGQNLEVVVKTDATGDKEFKGHVTLISPTSTTTTSFSSTSSGSSGSSGGTSSSSTANYKVSIELDEIDESFMIGMSAKVAIIVNQSPENSLCVPYNCIKETDDGKYIVKVLDENGDKNTADDMLPSSSNENEGRRNKDEIKTPNGIVVEIEDVSDTEKKDKGEKKGLFSGKSNEEPVEMGKRYREVEVDKIFDTDYYAAVVPKIEGSLKEGDEIIVVTEKSSGDDFMAMFAPM